MSEPLYQLRRPIKAVLDGDEGEESYAIIDEHLVEWHFMDKEAFDELFVRVDLEELADDDCGHDSMDGDGHGNWVCMCCKNTYSDHKDSAGFTYLELVREGHEHDFAWTFRHCRYCDKKIDVRVDPEELKTQLREELEQFYQLRCGWANGAGEDSDDEKWTDDTVDRVISLFFPVVNQETSDE